MQVIQLCGEDHFAFVYVLLFFFASHCEKQTNRNCTPFLWGIIMIFLPDKNSRDCLCVKLSLNSTLYCCNKQAKSARLDFLAVFWRITGEFKRWATIVTKKTALVGSCLFSAIFYSLSRHICDLYNSTSLLQFQQLSYQVSSEFR